MYRNDVTDHFSSFFLANKHARLFLFCYILLLHLLVWGTTLHHTHRKHSCDS